MKALPSRLNPGLEKSFAHLLIRPGDRCLIRVRPGKFQQGKALIVQPEHAILQTGGYHHDRAMADAKNTLAICRNGSSNWQLVRRLNRKSAQSERTLLAQALGIPRDEIPLSPITNSKCRQPTGRP